jgi:hypothetical protein
MLLMVLRLDTMRRVDEDHVNLVPHPRLSTISLRIIRAEAQR